MQTIHAFCTQLLHQFPFEANVAARFSVLDEAEQSQLLEQLTLDVLLDGAATPDSALGRALDSAMTAAADQTFRDVVREAIGQRDAISRWVDERGRRRCGDCQSVERARRRSRRTQSTESKHEFFAGSVIAPSEWPALAALGAGRQDRSPSRRDASQALRRLPAPNASKPISIYSAPAPGAPRANRS